jgi:hypothetical protein
MLELKRALDDFITNIYEFTEELIYLLKEDWYKFKSFIAENKNYVLWVFVLLITMQFTNLASLGKSWEKYCKTNTTNTTNTKNQKGGGNEAPKPGGEAEQGKPPGGEAEQGKPPGGDAEQGKPPGGEAEGQDDELKATDKKLSFIENLKGKVQKSAGQHGMLGPVFSQSGKIFDSIGAVFVIAGTILLVLGILTLPVLIFIIITYTIIKILVGKFFLL